MQLRNKVEIEPRSSAATGGVRSKALVLTTSQFRRKLQHAEIRVEVGINQRCLDGATGYSCTPLVASLDVATPSNVPSRLQYRLGVHQVGLSRIRHGAASQFLLRLVLARKYLLPTFCVWSQVVWTPAVILQNFHHLIFF